jgi:hypothetical protein
VSRPTAFIIAFLMATGMSAAGTLTLTGSCSKPLDGNTVIFALSNSRLSNDTAYNITLQQFIAGARSAESYQFSRLAPGEATNASIMLSNITARGTYADYFAATYQQGTNFFTAVFPCLLSFNNATMSQIYLTPSAASGPNETEKVSVSLLNAGSSNITANVSLILPPTFSYISGRRLSVGLVPYEGKNVSFYLGLPPSAQASYGVAAAVQYEKGNLSYAKYTTFLISQQKPATLDFGTVVLWASAAVIVLLAALLILVLLKKRKRGRT